MKEGDSTLLIHQYGHNIPRFIDDDMIIFGNYLKRMFKEIIGSEIEIGKNNLILY